MRKRSALFILILISLLPICFLNGAGGPAQPEAAQFEPIDTSDMVNLFSGNFTYNVPLLEVPGPEGNWPINMCYHAGVGPNTEATWVGLGWTLNPGSINRFLSGYPDDYWAGSVVNDFQISLQSGWGIGLNISFGPIGMSMNYDSSQGFGGVNGNLSLIGTLSLLGVDGGIVGAAKSLKENTGIGFDVNISAGSSGVGISTSLGLGVALGDNIGASLGVSAGVHTSQKPSFSSSAGVRYTKSYENSDSANSISLMGVSFSARSSGASFSAGGTGFQSQSSMNGSGHSSSSGFSIPIPLGMLCGIPGLSLGLSFYEWEFWLHERNYEISYGVLHQAGMLEHYEEEHLYSLSQIWYNDDAINIYDDAINFFENEYNQSGGSRSTREVDITTSKKFERNEIDSLFFSSEDNYSVNVQGLSGSFRPFMQKSYRIVDIEDENDEEITGGYEAYSNESLDDINQGSNILFRFDGDQGSNFAQRVNVNNNTERIRTFPGDNSRNYFGSKKIEPAIHPQTGLLIGFRITAEDGRIYEFFQPVMSYYQYSNTFNSDENSNLRNINELRTPYATSWLLTGIKGPDYIDVSDNGFSADDYGFWVFLRYEENTSMTTWRTPWRTTSYIVPPDNSDLEVYSHGCRKEVYLSSIETATHIAFFRENPEYRLDLLPAYIDVCRLSAYTFEQYFSTEHPSIATINCVFPFDREDIENSFSNASFYLVAQYEKDIDFYKYFDENNNLVIFPNQGEEDGDLTTIVQNLGNISDYDDESGDGQFSICSSLLWTQHLYPLYPSQYPCYPIEPVNVYLLISPSTGNYLVPTKTAKQLTSIEIKRKLLDCNYKTNYIETLNNSNNIESVEFDQDYILQNAAENSNSEQDGIVGINLDRKLTLTGFQKKGIDGVNSLPKTLFSYYGEFCAWNEYRADLWNGYTSCGTEDSRFNSQIENIANEDASTWNLKDIMTPLGSKITIEYESDRISKVNRHVPFFLATEEPTSIDIWFSFAIVGGNCVSGFSCDPADVEYLLNVIESDQEIFLVSYASNDEIYKVNSVKIGLADNSVDIFYCVDYDYTPNYIDILGNYSRLLIYDEEEYYLGGHRVKSIAIESANQSKKTLYNYISGVTSILPSQYIQKIEQSEFDNAEMKLDKYFLNEGFNILSLTPSVGYSSVEVMEVDPNDNDSLNINGKTVHSFYTAYDCSPEISMGTNYYGEDYFILKDWTGLIGRPRKIETFGINKADSSFYRIKVDEFNYCYSNELSTQSNNRKVLKKADNNTGFEVLDYSNNKPLGYTEQLLHSDNLINEKEYLVMIEKYNVFMTGTQSTTYLYDENYNPSGSVATGTENIGYDAYTGSILVTKCSNSHQKQEINETIPAYWKYDRLEDKNMLAQIAGSIGYNLSDTVNFWSSRNSANWIDNLNDNIIGASVTTWMDWYEDINTESGDPDTTIWRQNDTYTFIGDQSDFEMFDSWDTINPGETITNSVSGNDIWKRTSDIDQYDRYGHPTQEIGIDGVYTSSIYGYGEALPVAITTNARKDQTDYCSFESGDLTGNNFSWTTQTSTGTWEVTDEDAHNGAYCLKYDKQDTQTSFCTFNESLLVIEGESYTVNVWYKCDAGRSGFINLLDTNNQVNYSIHQEGTGGWELIELKVKVPHGCGEMRLFLNGDYGSANSPIYYDDVRIYPSDAAMNTFTYDPLTWKLTSMTDENNISTYYEYDNAGRLKLVRDQDGNILQQTVYKYGRDSEEE